MNTLSTPLNAVLPSDSAPGLYVRRACGLMLASLLVLPAHAERARSMLEPGDLQINNVGQRVRLPVGPALPSLPSQEVPLKPQGGVTQGEGPTVPRTQVANTAPPTAARTLIPAPVLPPTNIPTPGAGNTEATVNAARTSPPIKGMPGPGRGPEKPIMPGAGSAPEPSPTARTMVPSSPTPAAGPAIASPTQPTGAITINSTPSAPIGAVQPVPPMQGNPIAEMQPASPAQSNPGTLASLSPSSAPPAASIVEILPGVQKLSESMRELPAMQQQGSDKNATIAATSDKCVSVNLRPDTQRPGLSLVDLTGDGLIVSAVPDTHIQTVFAKAGYGQVDLSQTARWCITQTAARALVRPSSGVGTQQGALLVQTAAGLQLMSQDQWVAHQESIKPLVTAMTSPRPSKLTKPNNKLVAKRSGKPANGVAVSALRIPASTSKTSAGA